MDTVTQVGWLPLDGDVAKWAECFCPLPSFDPIVCHNASYDVGIMARVCTFYPIADPEVFLRRIKIHDTLALAYAQGKQDLSLKGLGCELHN